jgi:hypothetical protein
MRNRQVAVGILLAAAGWWLSHRRPVAPPPKPIPAPANTVLTNQDVIAMVKGQLSPSLIVNQIRASATNFDLSTAGVILLSKEGVPENVIEAMRNPKAASPFAEPEKPTPALPPPPPEPATPVPPTDPGVVALRPVTVLGGLPIQIALLSEVPAGAEAGTPLRFQVTRDYLVDGQVVIAQGAPASGELLGVGKKFLSLGGKVQFKLDTVTAVDGHKLHVKASPGRRSDRNEQRIEPPGHRGKDVLAPAGSQYLAYFDGDQTVNVKK